MVDYDDLVECGCCGSHHRKDFGGDCRQDNERFDFYDTSSGEEILSAAEYRRRMEADTL